MNGLISNKLLTNKRLNSSQKVANKISSTINNGGFRSNDLTKTGNMTIFNSICTNSDKYRLSQDRKKLQFEELSYRCKNKAQAKLEEVPSSYINTAKSINSKKPIMNNNVSLDSKCITTDRKPANCEKNKLKLEILKNKLINVQNRNIKVVKIISGHSNKLSSKDTNKKRKKKQPHQNLSLANPLITKSLFYK